jgi:AraC-like DNA-binding protein
MQPQQNQPAVKHRFHVRQRGVSSAFSPNELTGPVFDTSPLLPDVVEAMADWDVASPHQARALSFKCTPGYGLYLVVHYRTPVRSTWQFGSLHRESEHRHFATILQTGVATTLPRGPLGMITVRLKPEAATRLVGTRPRYFLDTVIGLEDLFGASRVSLLEEQLAEATTSTERLSHMRTFLLSDLRPRQAESVVSWAAALLRGDPSLRVRQLAARLDVSERHLCRDFSAMFGMGPKQFARIARIGRVLSARAQGASWADIAYATGFTDQAHMINDFTAIVGMSPAELGRQLTLSRWSLVRTPGGHLPARPTTPRAPNSPSPKRASTRARPLRDYRIASVNDLISSH